METQNQQFSTVGMLPSADTAAYSPLPPIPSSAFAATPGLMEGTEMKPQFQETMNHMAYHLQNTSQIDSATAEWLSKKESALSALWPSKEDKLRRDINWKMFTESGNLRVALYKMHAQYTLNSIRDNLNARLVLASAAIRHQTTDILANLFLDLVARVAHYQERLGAVMERKYAYIATLKSPGYKASMTAQMEKEEKAYLEWLNKGIEHFMGAIETQIKALK